MRRSIVWKEIQVDVEYIEKEGLSNLIKHKQSLITATHGSISMSTVLKTYSDNLECARLMVLAGGCPQPQPQNFVPNEGTEVRERKIPDMPMMAETLIVHAADEYHRGHSIILPLERAKKWCKEGRLPLHVSEMFKKDKQNSPLGRPIPDYRTGYPSLTKV